MESFPKKLESKPRKPGRWRRRLVWGVAMLAVLFTVGWITLTSNWFLRAALLPTLNQALNVKVRFENAEWTLGSQLRLEGVTLHATGERPLLKAARVEVNYQWRDLFAGRMEFRKIACEEPELFLHIDRNGKPNYAPLLDRPQSDSENKPIRIENFSVTNARVEYRRDHQSGSTETANFSGIHIVSSEIAAGQPVPGVIQGCKGETMLYTKFTHKRRLPAAHVRPKPVQVNDCRRDASDKLISQFITSFAAIGVVFHQLLIRRNGLRRYIFVDIRFEFRLRDRTQMCATHSLILDSTPSTRLNEC